MTPEEVNEAVGALAQRFQDANVDGDTAASTLLAYAIAIWNDTRGPADTAHHLFVLSFGLRHGVDAQQAAAMIERSAAGGATH